MFAPPPTRHTGQWSWYPDGAMGSGWQRCDALLPPEREEPIDVAAFQFWGVHLLIPSGHQLLAKQHEHILTVGLRGKRPFTVVLCQTLEFIRQIVHRHPFCVPPRDVCG
jgi:hypothetical protein